MTNGEKIKAIFPHYDIEIDEHKGYVRVFYEDFYTTYPLRWWGSEYKEPIDYKARYEMRSKKAEIEILISQLRADRDRLLDVLDKIRAEIKALSPEPTAYDVVDGNHIKDAVWETLADVLAIFVELQMEINEIPINADNSEPFRLGQASAYDKCENLIQQKIDKLKAHREVEE